MRFVPLPILATLLICGVDGQYPPKQVQINTPYVASTPQMVDIMLELAKVTSRDTVHDLGCGDGRIVISAAKKYGARGVGIDINPARIEEARTNARSAGVTGLVNFDVRDLFDADIRGATIVALYFRRT